MLYYLDKLNNMKKLLEIIIIIILFTLSTLIFWARFSPDTFFNFFQSYPVFSKTVNQVGIFDQRGIDLPMVNYSEPVTSNKGEIIVNAEKWEVEVVNNDTDRTNGLSNRKSLFNKQGMLFVFDELGKYSFWMKDMLIPIDMVFFDDNWQIVLIESNLSSDTFPQTFGGKIMSKYVLEINASEAINYGLKVGDQALFLNK